MVKAGYAIVALVVIEIIGLVVSPAIYYTYFREDNATIIAFEDYPLTDEQIKVSFPNMPNTEQIVKENQIYVFAGSIPIKNCTQYNPVHPIGNLPISYQIWLEYYDTEHNETRWLSVPKKYLVTDNPPPIPNQHQDSFLGTNIPTTQGIIAVALITLTVVACSSCLILNRKHSKSKTATLQN